MGKFEKPAPVRAGNTKRIRNILLAIAAVFVLILGGIGIWVVTDPYDFRMTEGVTLGGLDVSGLTPWEAGKAVNAAADKGLLTKGLTLEFPKETLMLYPEQAKLSVNTWSAVWDAFQAGREEDAEKALGLLPYLEYDEKAIRSVPAAYAGEYNTQYTPSSWRMEGEDPQLGRTKEETLPTPQTLVITMGIPQTHLDEEDAVAKILAAYDQAFAEEYIQDYTVRDFTMVCTQSVEKPDVEAIREELYAEAVNDSLDMQTYEFVYGSYGYDFDFDAAQKRTWITEPGKDIRIPMELTQPEITNDAVYFRDVLGYCETPHSTNENRNHNLKMACDFLDGVILQPGEVFSYNETLGERTKERGWKPAGTYSGTTLVNSYGGGICQVSSTIYCATLYADLEIVFRINHGIPVSYMRNGLDATVSWNGPDYQFRNNTHFPIKIAAEVTEKLVKVTLLGTEERDYYVEMETIQGESDTVIYARSYKCKYDRETGELISRELEARSNYLK